LTRLALRPNRANPVFPLRFLAGLSFQLRRNSGRQPLRLHWLDGGQPSADHHPCRMPFSLLLIWIAAKDGGHAMRGLARC